MLIMGQAEGPPYPGGQPPVYPMPKFLVNLAQWPQPTQKHPTWLHHSPLSALSPSPRHIHPPNFFCPKKLQ